MRRRDETLKNGLIDHIVRVEISMSHRFFKKIEVHRLQVAENNRSAWIRRAMLKLMREEQEDLRAEVEG